MAKHSRCAHFVPSHPLTAGQAEQLILIVLRAYGKSVVENTPSLARHHVKAIVDATNRNLERIVRDALHEVACTGAGCRT